jgi:hypothetical protein
MKQLCCLALFFHFLTVSNAQSGQFGASISNVIYRLSSLHTPFLSGAQQGFIQFNHSLTNERRLLAVYSPLPHLYGGLRWANTAPHLPPSQQLGFAAGAYDTYDFVYLNASMAWSHTRIESVFPGGGQMTARYRQLEYQLSAGADNYLFNVGVSARLFFLGFRQIDVYPGYGDNRWISVAEELSRQGDIINMDIGMQGEIHLGCVSLGGHYNLMPAARLNQTYRLFQPWNMDIALTFYPHKIWKKKKNAAP